eukprot:comp22980_c0_seq1/m.36560 comp22980_c0_seq1/g.36560  ORF comp22980_c0_seq1/g.36560 comp22980_c0_seq1/m.36560 type:complete len:306 (-) comp22980_c0_seq1:735-1652(-)
MSGQINKAVVPIAAALSFVAGAGVTYFLLKPKAPVPAQQQPAAAVAGKRPPPPPQGAPVQPPTPGSSIASQPGDIMKYGWPGFENIKKKEGHILSYDRKAKTAHWVCERINRQQLQQRNAERSACQFFEDMTEHELFRAKLNDYRRSGYDRGHLAAAGNHNYSATAMCDTFSLSNMSPQVGKGFNRDYWNSLEGYARGLTKEWENVYMCTGPLYLPTQNENGRTYVKYEVIGETRVAVPTHFFKTLLMEKDGGSTVEIQAFILPNAPIDESTPLQSFRVPLQEVERASGHLFYENLPGKYAKVKV